MADISGVKLNKNFQLNQTKDVTKEKLKEVADMYEKHFIKEMMKQMKSTVVEGTGMFKKNNAEKIFQEQLDDEYSSEWNKQGSFGMSKLIYDQLMDRFGGQFGLTKPIDKPEGPIDLDEKHEIKDLKPLSDFSIKIDSKNKLDGNQTVKNPWAGTLQSKDHMSEDKTMYKIKHDNGLESLITIQGAASEKSRFLSAGDTLQAGQELGLAAEASPLFWTVRANSSES
jgi:peptidoglycan hydrolase FlgJ